MSTSTNVNYENGQKLKGFRKQNKLSQSVIAEFVGKNFRTVSNWESGKIAIPTSIINKLNKKYKLNLKVSDSSVSSTKSSTVTKSPSKSVSTSSSSSRSTSVSKIDFSSFRYVKSASVYTRWSNLRKYTNLSQVAFANMFHFSPVAVSRYESQKMDTISFESLRTMIKSGIDLNAFFA